MNGRSRRTRWWALVLAAALLPSALAGQTASAGDADARAFSTVVDALRREADGVLLVDPRPLVPGAELTGVEAADLSPASLERGRALERAGVTATDFLADQRCLFARGLPVPPEAAPSLPDSIAAAREACRARPSATSAVVGLPAENASDGEVVVPVAWMTTSRYVVQRFHLRSRPSGAVEVVRVESVADVMS